MFDKGGNAVLWELVQDRCKVGKCGGDDFSHRVAARVVLTEVAFDRLCAEVAYEPIGEVVDDYLTLLSGQVHRTKPLVEISPACVINLHR